MQESIVLLQKAYKEYGKPLASRAHASWRPFVPGIPSTQWYCKKFGSWNAALKQARLPVAEEFKLPDLNKEEVLSALINLRKKLNRDFLRADLIKARGTPASLTHVTNQFGTISEAKRELAEISDNGLTDNSGHRYLTKSAVITRLRRSDAKSITDLAKNDPTFHSYVKQKYPGLLREIFGRKIKSWKNLSKREFCRLISESGAKSRSLLAKKEPRLYQAALKYCPQALDSYFGK